VRHGAAPRIEATTIRVTATLDGRMLALTVVDDGMGAQMEDLASTAGTGLRRLRERLSWLYGHAASLTLNSVGGGFSARLLIPQDSALAAHAQRGSERDD
jgi:signal transduction histidine kinase